MAGLLKRGTVLAIAGACASVLATTSGAAQTFRSGVDIVLLHVAVTDSDGRFVTGLTRDEFSVYEDEAPRPIEQFAAERVPVSLGILIDVSRSMDGRRFTDARQALAKLVERFERDDRMFLGVFGSAFRLLVPWTNDHDALLGSLSGVTVDGGSTFLYSSISAALPVLNAGPNRKKALVVITDGNDNERMAGLNRNLLLRALDQAQQSEALLYVIGIGTAKVPIDLSADRDVRWPALFDPPVDVEELRQLTDPTGGYTQVVSSSDGLPSAVISIADDLSAQYVIGFESAYADSRFHTLKVQTKNSRYQIRARTR